MFKKKENYFNKLGIVLATKAEYKKCLTSIKGISDCDVFVKHGYLYIILKLNIKRKIFYWFFINAGNSFKDNIQNYIEAHKKANNGVLIYFDYEYRR